MMAGAKPSEGNFLFHAVGRIFERDLKIVAQVGAAAGTAARAATVAEEILEATAAATLAKHLAENIEGIVETAAAASGTAGTGAALLKCGMTIPIIGGAFFGGFGVMHSMVFNQIGGLLAVGNGLMPLRKIAEARAEKEKIAEYLAGHATA